VGRVVALGTAGLRYLAADGCDLAGATDAATRAGRGCAERKPAVLHLRTTRLMGHAGTDFEGAYRSAPSVRADIERDPLVGTGRLLVEAGADGSAARRSA
jgi:2-oxoisovalerate dehydrogenase E1 component